jgi:carbon monoxide dehydrogenase subunit G
MIVEGTYTFPGTPTVVFQLLLDPEVLAKTMPGATHIARVSDDRYEGKMGIGIGPITAAEFDVIITIADKVVPSSYQMQIEGKGKFGFTRGKAAVTLHQEGAATVMTYQADMMVGGKVAAVGQRLLDSVSRMLLKQGLEAMSAELDRRLAGGAA